MPTAPAPGRAAPPPPDAPPGGPLSNASPWNCVCAEPPQGPDPGSSFMSLWCLEQSCHLMPDRTGKGPEGPGRAGAAGVELGPPLCFPSLLHPAHHSGHSSSSAETGTSNSKQQQRAALHRPPSPLPRG